MRQYATASQLAAYSTASAGVPGADADRLLRTASYVVDRLLRGVVYATDTDGLPTDANVASALQDAVCAIVAENYEVGAFKAGASKEWSQVGIGNVRLSGRGPAAGTIEMYGLTIPVDAVTALGSVGDLTVVLT